MVDLISPKILNFSKFSKILILGHGKGARWGATKKTNSLLLLQFESGSIQGAQNQILTLPPKWAFCCHARRILNGSIYQLILFDQNFRYHMGPFDL